MKRLLFVVIVLLTIAGCAAKPKMPEQFKEDLREFYAEGAVLNAMTEQGVSYVDFVPQLAKTKGAYDIAISSWPEEYMPEAKIDFDMAFVGWNYTLSLWKLKVNGDSVPSQTDVAYQGLMIYGGDKLILSKGAGTILFDNIGVLMSMASDYYDQGKQLLAEDYAE